MLQRAESRQQIVARLLVGQWWTLSELADFACCTAPQTWKLLKVIGRGQIVFRRHRKRQRYQPWEYRSFPRAVNVRLR